MVWVLCVSVWVYGLCVCMWFNGGVSGVMWVYGLFSYIDDVGALLVYVYVYVYGVVWVY